MCKVFSGYCGASEIEHGLCACTVDNPLAKARGLSLRTGVQTMLYLSHNTKNLHRNMNVQHRVVLMERQHHVTPQPYGGADCTKYIPKIADYGFPCSARKKRLC